MKKYTLLILAFVLCGGLLYASMPFQAQAEDVVDISSPPTDAENLTQVGGELIAPFKTQRAQNTISRTYTLNADFDEGTMINVNHDAPNNDQLQLNANPTTFPFIWVPASDRGTVIKIDTETGDILGEYRTAPDGRGKNPSRTTVDMDGNVWVGNRNEGNGGLGSAVHVGLEENSQCVDRNGNGVIDTSTGLGDIKDWSNAGGADNNGGVSTAEDECIIHYVRTSGTHVRHLSVDADNDVWIGGYGNRKFDLVDGATGAILRTVGPFGCGGYGGLVDGNGVLWSARGGSKVLRYDPASNSSTCIGISDSYGMGVDGQGNIWTATYWGSRAYKISPDGTILDNWPTGGTRGRGVAVDANDNVWIANSSSDTVTRLDTDGNQVASVSVCSHPVGVAVDAAGKIWAPCRYSHNVARIDPATNDVDLTVSLGNRADPYTYSDMTGMVAMGRTAPQGTWRVIYDSGKAGTPWGKVSWNSSPTGTVTVRARSAELTTTLGNATYVTVTNGAMIDSLPNGRYIQVEVKLEPDANGNSPEVYDVTVQGAPPPCLLTHDKTAFPSAVTVGSGVTVTLSMQAVGDCTSTGSPVDAMLVIDRSGSMGGQKLADAKAAANTFIGEMGLPPDRVGVVSFASSGQGNRDIELTDKAAAVTTTINSLNAGGMTDMEEGLEIAETELLDNGEPAKSPVIIILSDGHHNESPAGDLQATADRIKGAGIRIISIGLGNADENQLKAIASSDNDYYYAPDSSQLAGIYQQIAPTMWVAGRNMVLTDTLSSYATLIPDSFQGPISPTVNGDRLQWQIAAIPVRPVTLTYQVAMTSTPGVWDTNESAIATYIDSSGNDASLVFPKPQVVVPAMCEEPDISALQPAWACVGEEVDPLAISGSGFITITDFTAITGTFGVDAYVSMQELGIHSWSHNLINSVLPGNSGLSAGKHDVTVVNNCHLATVIPGGSSHPTPTVGPYTDETYTGTLRDGLRLYPAPSVLSIRPNEGYNTTPSDITICGEGFAPGTKVYIDDPVSGTIELEDQAAYGETCLAGTVPSGLQGGEQVITVQGPCGAITGTYRVLTEGLNNDLWGMGEELWLDPSICARECDDISMGLIVHRRGGKKPISVTVAFTATQGTVPGDKWWQGQLIGKGTSPLIPTRVNPSERIAGFSTSAVDWTPPQTGTYTLYAKIDPHNVISEDIEINNVVSRTVQVLPCPPEVDRVAPRVDSFEIKGGVDTTYNIESPLSLSATDFPRPGPNTGVARMNFVEYLFNDAADVWVPVQVSGWQTFAELSRWSFYPEGGMRFLQAWASDGAGNISRYPNFKYINYIKPCAAVSRNGVRIYRQSVEEGDILHVEVAPCNGDPDLYIWPSDWEQGQPPWVKNQSGNAIEQLSIPITTTGEYQIEVYGYTSARYNINIEVEEATTSMFQALLDTVTRTPLETGRRAPTGAMAKLERNAPALPPSSEPGTDMIPVDPAPYEVSEGPGTLKGVMIDGPATGSINTTYTYTATVLPQEYAGTVGWPITYTWEATGQETKPYTSTANISSTHTVTFAWSSASPATKTITVTVADGSGSPVSDNHETVITAHNIYLPLVIRNS
jgi:streptogramin lyase/uncharacterized protein YegL